LKRLQGQENFGGAKDFLGIVWRPVALSPPVECHSAAPHNVRRAAMSLEGVLKQKPGKVVAFRKRA